jgi:hypothetical protein
MARLMVLWTNPTAVSAHEVEEWIRREAVDLHRLPAVKRLELTRLARASDRHARPADWLLEIKFDDAANSEDCVNDPRFARWFGDMRQMRWRPSVVLADRTRVIDPGER